MYTIRPELARVCPANVERAKILLDRRLGPSKVLTSAESCERFSRDESEAEGYPPDAVVLAESADDVRVTLEIAAQTEVPVTPRAAGTGRTGGAVPLCGGIVLATGAMRRIVEVNADDMLAVVQPGVVLADLHAEVESQGLFYPPDPNSLDNCAIGGNVAENAGGPRALKYGVTREYVLGLDAVLMGGTCLRVGRRTIKGVAGYDMTALLVGSEGTLGVITEVTLKLIPKPETVMTVLALFSDVRAAARTVPAMLCRRVVPRCVEMVDAGALAAIRSQAVAIDERASAFLLIEVDGDEAACERDLERVSDACDETGALDVLAAQSTSQRSRLWAARRELSPAIRKMARNKLAEDVVVPRSRIADLLKEVERMSESLRIRTISYGHAGDGNLHVNFLWDNDDEVERVKLGIEKLFATVIEMRGTISGEHGIGVLKAPYLHMEQSAELIETQRQVKAVFDPRGLLNPGKIFARSGHGAC